MSVTRSDKPKEVPFLPLMYLQRLASRVQWAPARFTSARMPSALAVYRFTQQCTGNEGRDLLRPAVVIHRRVIWKMAHPRSTEHTRFAWGVRMEAGERLDCGNATCIQRLCAASLPVHEVTVRHHCFTETGRVTVFVLNPLLRLRFPSRCHAASRRAIGLRGVSGREAMPVLFCFR